LPLEDYLMPHENIRYQSDFDILYAGKQYMVILTDIRLILYSRRGLVFKSDDVITEAIRDIQGIKYKEKGILLKKSYLEIQSYSKIILEGKQASIKTLYQRLLPFLCAEMRATHSYQEPPQSTDIPMMTQTVSSSFHYCPSCGIELSANEKFCHNCGQPFG
jgi:hypothetical protein